MNEETPIDNKLDLMKALGQVQSDIKDRITSDFVLAKLDEKKQELIVNTTSNAYFCKSLIERTKERKIWKWNGKNWEETEQTKEDKNKIDEAGRRTFNAFMTKNTMIAVLNRNIKNNYLIRLMTGLNEEENEEEEDDKSDEIIKKLKAQIKPEKN